ncbi:MAG: ABC transporter ATP-binding protein [Planctomycetia bacterium]|nr:ABC transporter ATP-binding protein [Planctomycetia bacterium]
MIAVENLSIRAGHFALDDLSFQVASGAYAVLMGKTGCGKTTILEAICGLRTPRGGRILLLDRDVTRLPPAVRGIGYVPQDLALFRTMTVAEHLAFPLVIRRWPRSQVEERVAEVGHLLGIESLFPRKPVGLSGGESQRVALGRALAFQPRVLLLDEPLSALDEDTRLDMCNLLRTVQKQTGVTFLHVTHNPAEARRLADQVLRFQDGKIREESPQGIAGDESERFPIARGGSTP